jgi:hypothetical protein
MFRGVLSHPHLTTNFPTPLLFLAAVKMTERPGWGWPLFAGLCLAAQFYLGMYLGYMAGLMLGLLLLTYACYAPREVVRLRFLSRLGLAAAVAAVSLLPLARQYHHAAQRWGYWAWQSVASYIPPWQNLFLHSFQTGEALV